MEFTLLAEQEVSILIFDIQGKKVKTIDRKTIQPGMNSVKWDGTDSHGCNLPSGMYFIQISIGKKVSSFRIVKIK